MSRPLSKKQRQLQDDVAIHAANVVKFASLLVLRNQGWGATRLIRFSERFDELLVDINEDRLTFSDLMIALEEETGLKSKELIIHTR